MCVRWPVSFPYPVSLSGREWSSATTGSLNGPVTGPSPVALADPGPSFGQALLKQGTVSLGGLGSQAQRCCSRLLRSGAEGLRALPTGL